uniref:Uncharacterized protein n=1 Tax=Romanomermis culicivorax TaxID=13658 RepID=A0A915JLU7_ROMCU
MTTRHQGRQTPDELASEPADDGRDDLGDGKLKNRDDGSPPAATNEQLPKGGVGGKDNGFNMAGWWWWWPWPPPIIIAPTGL